MGRDDNNVLGRYALALVVATLLQLPLIELLLLQASSSDEIVETHSLRGVRGTLIPMKTEAKKPDEMPRGQVVDLPQPRTRQTPPPDARFLSRWDTATARERKARDRGVRSGDTMGQPLKTRSQVQSPESTSIEETMLEPAKTEARLPVTRTEAERDRGTRAARTGPIKGLDNLYLPAGNGPPKMHNVQTISGGFASDDALPEIRDEGDSTILNARSFKYWDFFQRVKERVRQEWEPGDVYRRRDPYGKVYGTKDRLTILSVVLDSSGGLVRLEVAKESGLPFLDQEAMRAFREAAPFPNPPKGLADEKGRIAFNFGFLLEMSTSKFRFFWQRPE